MLVFLLAALSTSLPVGLLRGYWQNRGVPVTQTMMQLVNMASYCYSLLLPLLFMVLFQGPGRTSRPLFPLARPRRSGAKLTEGRNPGIKKLRSAAGSAGGLSAVFHLFHRLPQ